MPNAYTPQSEIARRQALMEAMAGRNTTGQGIGGGLANMLRSYRGAKENRALGEAETNNAQIQSDEMQAYINAMKQGGLQGPPTPGGQRPDLRFQTPELQNMQLKQAMGQSNLRDEQAREDALSETDRFYESVNQGQEHQQEMELQRLRNEGYESRGVSGGAQMAGQNIVDTANGNAVVGTWQASRNGPPVTYGLDGAPLEMKDSYRVIGSAAQGDQTPSVLRAATDQQADTAGQIRGATVRSEQEVINEFQGREAQAKIGLTESNKNTTIAAIDRILGHEGLGAATGKSSYFRGYIPGPAKDAKILIEQLGNRMFVDALQAMRDASKTGGAVGNVSDREGDRMENVIAAITNTKLTDEEMVFQLKLAKEILQTYQRDVQAAWEAQFGASANSSGRPPLSSFQR